VLVRRRFPVAAREHLQERPSHLRMLLHEGAELPRREPVAEQVGRRDDRGRPDPVVDEGDLAEVVARPERRTVLVPDRDLGVALDDDEEPGSGRAFGRDLRALGKAALVQLPSEVLQVALVEIGEERDVPQGLDGGDDRPRGGPEGAAAN
jgi:hypothetical protein